MRPVSCSSCGGNIAHITLDTGTEIAIERTPTAGGNVEIRQGHVRLIRPAPRKMAYQTHYAECRRRHATRRRR